MHFSKFVLFGIFSLLCISIYSCNSPEYLSAEELSEFAYNNRNLSKSIVSSEIQIRAIYKPTDLLVAQEIRNTENPTPTEIQAARNKYSNHYYFILSFSQSGKEVLN